MEGDRAGCLAEFTGVVFYRALSNSLSWGRAGIDSSAAGLEAVILPS